MIKKIVVLVKINQIYLKINKFNKAKKNKVLMQGK